MFQFYEDEEMTKTTSLIENTGIVGEKNVVSGVIYFGCPDKNLQLQTRAESGINPIMISPFFRLPEIARNTQYTKTATRNTDLALNGFVYRLVQSGKTAANAPLFSQNIGDEIMDGTALWRCVAEAHKVAEIKLALSEEQLETAAAGTPLSIGRTVKGGAAVAIYYSIENGVDRIFSDFDCPQLSLSINECVIDEIKEN